MQLSTKYTGFGIQSYTVHKTEADALKFITDNKLDQMGDVIKVEKEEGGGARFVIVAYEADGYRIGEI